VGVTGYKIFRNGSQVGTSSTTTYSDSGLSASTSYAYTVAAYDAAGNTSGNSTAGTATTPGTSGSAVQGFAAANGVTGGAGGQRIVVTNLNDTGPGSLRQAVQYTSGPRVVTFTPGLTGTITNASKNLHVQSNDLTLDGAGANITISGYSFNIYNSATLTATRNVIVKNLTFANTTAGVSAINIERGSNTVWIDHNTFVNNSSGSTGEPINIWNYTGAADTMTGITISWCRFNTYNKKAILVGSGEQTVKKNTRVSIHHNWFNGTTARNPFIHGGNLAHIWNNYIYAWKEHGIAGSSRADILAQNNIFENGANSNALVPSYNLPGALSADSANASGNLIIGNGVISTRGTFPMNQLTYSVTPEVADNALKNRIISGAGAHP
jgi:pectate lyase